MADIIDPQVIAFANTQIRKAANRLAQVYYEAKTLSNVWVANGSGADALTALMIEIRLFCDNFVNHHNALHLIGLHWQSYQSQVGIAPIPNTVDKIIDGSPIDGRPGPNTGADANLVINRVQEMMTWGDTGAFTATANNGGGGAWLYTIFDVSHEARVPDLIRAGLVISRCNELVIDYEASSNVKLNTILSWAPNPTG